MTAGNVLKLVAGLTRDKLSYFVRAGYVTPKKIKRGTLDQNLFSERDVFLIKRAWEYISRYETRPKAAFEKAVLDYPQMGLDFDGSVSSGSRVREGETGS